MDQYLLINYRNEINLTVLRQHKNQPHEFTLLHLHEILHVPQQYRSLYVSPYICQAILFIATLMVVARYILC
jgi:hypothetical protein